MKRIIMMVLGYVIFLCLGYLIGVWEFKGEIKKCKDGVSNYYKPTLDYFKEEFNSYLNKYWDCMYKE